MSISLGMLTYRDRRSSRGMNGFHVDYRGKQFSIRRADIEYFRKQGWMPGTVDNAAYKETILTARNPDKSLREVLEAECKLQRIEARAFVEVANIDDIEIPLEAKAADIADYVQSRYLYFSEAPLDVRDIDRKRLRAAREILAFLPQGAFNINDLSLLVAEKLYPRDKLMQFYAALGIKNRQTVDSLKVIVGLMGELYKSIEASRPNASNIFVDYVSRLEESFCDDPASYGTILAYLGKMITRDAFAFAKKFIHNSNFIFPQDKAIALFSVLQVLGLGLSGEEIYREAEHSYPNNPNDMSKFALSISMMVRACDKDVAQSLH